MTNPESNSSKIREHATIELLVSMATSMREVFERLLASSLGRTNTHGSCLYAAILITSCINQFSDASAKVCGGGPPMDGGLKDKDGILRGHYWVEGHFSNGADFLVDITSDQFDYDKVVVLPLDAARSRYFPGDQVLVEQHVMEEEVEMASASE